MASIKAKVAGITFIHRLCGYPSPAADFLVVKALLGLVKSSARSDTRTPITPQFLRRLLKAAVVFDSKFMRILSRALLATMFFGFLWVGEVSLSKHNIKHRQVSFGDGC